MAEQRLQKIIANSGVTSRRHAEELIKAGRVKVNGQVADRLGLKYDPSNIDIEVDGHAVSVQIEFEYFLLNKPRGFVSTTKEVGHQRPVTDLIKTKSRIYPVGRLDKDTTGALLLTNDGDFTQKLIHPSFEINKVYLAQVKNKLGGEVKRLTVVNTINGVTYAPAEYEVVDDYHIRLIIHEGKNHEVKILLDAIGHPVTSLHREIFAGIPVGDLKVGEYRQLTNQEVARLKQ